MEATTEATIGAICGGSHDVIAAAYLQHAPALRMFVRRLVGDAESAADVTHEVFACACGYFNQTPPDARYLRAWLFAVARRKAVDELRARRRSQALTAAILPSSAAEDAFEAHVAASSAHAIAAAVAGLAPTARTIVQLRLLEGRSFREIAEAAGTTEAASRMQFSRGVRELRLSLAEAQPGNEA